MQLKTTAGQFEFGLSDFTKGLVITVIASVLMVIYQAVDGEGGWRSIDWNKVIDVSITSGIAYLIKNFFAPAQVIVKNAPKETIQLAKENDVKVDVVDIKEKESANN